MFLLIVVMTFEVSLSNSKTFSPVNRFSLLLLNTIW